MAFRDQKTPSDDSSSDEEEGACKRPRQEEIEDQDVTVRSKYTVWSDVVIDQSLCQQLSTEVGVPQKDSVLVPRDVESYDAPLKVTRLNRPPGFLAKGRRRGSSIQGNTAQKRGPKLDNSHLIVGAERGQVGNQQQQQQQQQLQSVERMDEEGEEDNNKGPVLPVVSIQGPYEDSSNDAHENKTAGPPPPSPNDLDDPFGDAFEEPVEEIGIKKSHHSKLAPNRNVIAELSGRLFPDEMRRTIHGHSRNGRGRARGVKRPFSRDAGSHHNRGHQLGQKSFTKRADVKEGYSVQGLQATEFPLGLDLHQLGMRMADALGESKPEVIVRAVECLGEEDSVRVFNQTRDTEAAGGLWVNDRSRKRTPGGVFLYLLREDANITQIVKDKVFEESVEKRKQMKAVRRHQNKQRAARNADVNSFEESLRKAKLALEKQKSTEKIATTAEDKTMLDDLPNIKDVQMTLADIDTKNEIDEESIME